MISDADHLQRDLHDAILWRLLRRPDAHHHEGHRVSSIRDKRHRTESGLSLSALSSPPTKYPSKDLCIIGYTFNTSAPCLISHGAL